MSPQEIVAEVTDHIRGMWRYRWWAAGITWLIFAGGLLYVYSLPPVYRASAQVFVDTNSLIGPLMRGLTATRDTSDDVQLVSTAVLSRPNLEEVARRTDLIRRADPAHVENVVTRLQRRIAVRGGRDNIFNIQYEDTNRERARGVVAAVLDTFVGNTLGNQDDDAEATEEALAGEIREHEQRLLGAETRLAEFKRDNVGYMPNEYGDFAGRLQAALAAVAQTRELIGSLTERRDALRRQIEGEQPIAGWSSAACPHSEELREQLASLRLNYTDKHPRIVALRETIASLDERCLTETEAGQASPPSSGPMEANPVFQDLQIQLNASEVELAALSAQLQSEQNLVDQLRRDVDKIAQVETELKQLDRNYAVVQERHQALLSRWEDLQAKKRLDPVMGRVQFRSIEPPFALAEPVGPNRALLLAIVGGVALAVGGAVAFGLNQLRPVFFTSEKLRRAVPFPVLGSVTMILSPRANVGRRLGVLTLAASYLILVICIAAAVVYAESGAEVVRNLIGETVQ